jgi:TspO/MBR family protein
MSARDEAETWGQLRDLGVTVVPYLLEAYRSFRKSEGRVAGFSFHWVRANKPRRHFGWKLKPCPTERPELALFVAQLAANALWTWLLFVWQQGGLAFGEILLLWGLCGHGDRVLAIAPIGRCAAAALRGVGHFRLRAHPFGVEAQPGLLA